LIYTTITRIASVGGNIGRETELALQAHSKFQEELMQSGERHRLSICQRQRDKWFNITTKSKKNSRQKIHKIYEHLHDFRRDERPISLN